MVRKTSVAVTLVVILSLLMVGVAGAITIVVDGNQEAAWTTGVGAQVPGVATDLNEPAINDNVDIQTLRWTNDPTNFYFLVATWATPPLMPPLAPIDICLNTDNSGATDIPASNTIQRNRCSYGTGVTGIDTVVEAYRLNNGTLLADVYDVTTATPTLVGTGVLGYNPAATTPVVEISVPLTSLGFGVGSCPATIPTVVYYDGGDTNPDDNLPDSGALNISCGDGTAVTLSSLQAQPTTSPVLPVALVGVSAVALIGVIFLARRKKTA
jgi:hypothetical protein